MQECELKTFRAMILAQIMELEAHSEATINARATVTLDQQSVGRLSRMDAIERKSMADATERLRLVEIRKLKAALKRLDDDEFGYCADCGDEIGAERLRLNPSVTLCADCMKG